MHVWDLRTESAVGTICGPKICGDSIDVKGQYILTGAHRGRDQLQVWDLGSQKLIETLAWNEGQEVTSVVMEGIQRIHLQLPVQ